ncbi:MAG: glutamate 5-kinase [Thermoanaerobaculia bacterium]|nr:glutamate 5-kinase [Thermoanaerobaculia bacterium]
MIPNQSPHNVHSPQNVDSPSQPPVAVVVPDALDPHRPEITAARRIVVKVGTRALLDEEGKLARKRLAELVTTLAGWQLGGREVVLVSSGAVGVGRSTLGGVTQESSAEACAAVGQGILIGAYERAFGLHGLTCGQLLLSQRDVDDRLRAVRLASTLGTLLRRGVIPILNENDALEMGQGIATEDGPRSAFTDNDRLAALISGLLGADLLVVLTDVSGLCDRDPTRHHDAECLDTFDLATDGDKVRVEGSSVGGRGGMASKLGSAAVAARGGCGVVIASGREPGTLSRVLGGESIGTWIPPCGRLLARDRWIAFSPVARGYLALDAGAVQALRDRGASLLATGVVGVGGGFATGDVLELRGPDGSAVGRARIRHDAKTVAGWLTEDRHGITLIRRSDIVLEPTKTSLQQPSAVRLP